MQLSQNLAFNPNPVQVELKTSTGQDIVSHLGDDFTFDTPQGAGDLIVTPTYTLSGDYVSTIDGGLALDLLEATIPQRSRQWLPVAPRHRSDLRPAVQCRRQY